MNRKDGRCSPALEEIPTLHGRAFRHEGQFVAEVLDRRAAPSSVYDRLAIEANRVVQRQVGCISIHAKLQFRWHDMNVLGREPGPGPSFHPETTIRIKMPLLPLDFTELLQDRLQGRCLLQFNNLTQSKHARKYRDPKIAQNGFCECRDGPL